MKNIENLLQELSRQDIGSERKETTLTESEIKRLHEKTLQKINGEIHTKTNVENRKSKKQNNITTHPSFWRRYSRPFAAAAAACLVCMVGVTAFAAFSFDDSIRNFFNIYDNQSQQTAEKLTTNVNASDESNGIRLDLTQTIGDHSGFYAVINASDLKDVPYTLEFGSYELAITGKDGTSYDYTADTISSTSVNKGITKFPMLVSGINNNGNDVDINNSQIALSLKNIGYRNNHGRFVTLQKGSWKLNWIFQTNAEPEQINVDKDIRLMDSEGHWTNIVVSPLSLTAHYTITKQGKTHFTQKEWNKYEKSDRLTIDFTDGSRIDSRFEDDVTESWGDASNEGYKRIGFNQIIDAKTIASVTFGGETITLHQTTATDKRIRISSKAAKCFVELPESVAELITLKEKNAVTNPDFGCSEATATFMAKRGGAKMPLFTIHRLKGSFTGEKMEELNPMMIYVGSHNGYTYTIEYGECQTDAQLREFADIMNKYIVNILPFFEYAD